jgi:hypothetical protein
MIKNKLKDGKSKSTKGKEKMTTNGASVPANTANVPPPSESQVSRPKLVFHCQQAHGSPTGVISEFTNVKELYEKIAECYDITAKDILFCTLNTHKVDMTRLLGGQLGLDDFIFAHIRGQPKVVDITKSEDALGLTITDNGDGIAFIKAIREGSLISQIEGICVGDHIEKINDVSMIGCRHYDVAKTLKSIPRGDMFSLRLVEPIKSGFALLDGKSGGRKSGGNISSGMKTLRLRSKGEATVEVPDDVSNIAIDKINALLETFLGISDSELAQSIWETGSQTTNPSDFAAALESSDLRQFAEESFLFDLWGAISDAKQGRLKKTQEFSEQF